MRETNIIWPFFSKITFIIVLILTVYIMMPSVVILCAQEKCENRSFLVNDGIVYKVLSTVYLERNYDEDSVASSDLLYIDDSYVGKSLRFYKNILPVVVKHKLRLLRGERSQFLYKDEDYFLKAYRENKLSSDAVFALTDYYRYFGRYHEAEVALTNFLDNSPFNVDAMLRLGILYATNGRYGEGEVYLREAISLEPDNVGAYMILGKILRNKGQHNDAEEMFEIAKEIDSNETEVSFYEGYNYLDQGNFEMALESFNSMEGDYNLASRYSAVGDVYVTMGEYVIAEDYYFKSISIDPTIEMAYLGLGSLYMEKGHYNWAKKVFDVALSINVKSDAYYGIGILMQKMEKNREAIDYFKKTLSLDSDYPGAYLGLSRSYYALGDFEGAVREAVQRLNYVDTDDALLHLGDIYLQKGDVDTARRYWQKMVDFRGEIELLRNSINSNDELDSLRRVADNNRQVAAFLSRYYHDLGNLAESEVFASKVQYRNDEIFLIDFVKSKSKNYKKIAICSGSEESGRIVAFALRSYLTDLTWQTSCH